MTIACSTGFAAPANYRASRPADRVAWMIIPGLGGRVFADGILGAQVFGQTNERAMMSRWSPAGMGRADVATSRGCLGADTFRRNLARNRGASGSGVYAALTPATKLFTSPDNCSARFDRSDDAVSTSPAAVPVSPAA